MTAPWIHRKLDFPRGDDRLPVYADLYRFGEAKGPAPLLMFLGGASKKEKYIARRGTAPDHIAAEVAKAWARRGRPRLDLVACPDQIDTRPSDASSPAGVEWWEAHFDEQLAPELGATPSSIGLVGHSAGAPTALYLGLFLLAGAVATLGGAGLISLLSPDVRGERAIPGKLFRKLISGAQADGWEGFEARIYRNAEDGSDAPPDVSKAIPPPLRGRSMPAGPGGHEFRFYAATAAFAFVIERIVP